MLSTESLCLCACAEKGVLVRTGWALPKAVASCRWTLTPASGLDFGATTAGGSGVMQPVEVANTGEFALTIRAGSGRPGTTVSCLPQQHACMHGTMAAHMFTLSQIYILFALPASHA